MLAAERGRLGERYILGSREGNLLLPDFLALMERVSGVPRALPRGGPLLSRLRRWRRHDKGFRPQALTCDPSKSITELGMPQTPLAAAFAEAVAWFRENGYSGGG